MLATALLTLLLVIGLNPALAQDQADLAPEPPAATVFFEAFDNTSAFTTSTPFFSDASGDYFGLAGTSPDWGGDPAPSALKTYFNVAGNYLSGMDLDGEGAALPITLNWTGIHIATVTYPEFSGLFGEVFDSPGDIDGGDYIRLYYQVDGGGYQNLLWFSGADFSSSGGPFNGIFRQDTNFDGVGDGMALTDTLNPFSAALPAGTTLDLRMEISVDSGDEDFAVDSFEVRDDATGPSLVALTPPDDATDVRTDQTLTLTFNEPLQFTTDTTKRLQLFSNSLGSIESFYPTDPADPISIVNGNTVVVNPTNPLPPGENFYVLIDNDMILDMAGNGYAGIASNSTWNFDSITPAAAVNAPYLQDFEATCPPANWQIFSDDSDTSNTWACVDASGDTVLDANGFGNSDPADEWLISPEIDFSSLAAPTATFETWTRFADGGIAGEELDFLYSTDYDGAGGISSATWTELGYTPSPEDSQVWTPSGAIDLSAIGATSAYFAFRYQASGTGGGSTAWWRMDDFSIDEPPPPDVLINELGISDTGTPDAEFFELFGAAGTSLDNTYLIGIHALDSGGDTNRTGKVQFVLDLSANVIQADGFFVGSTPEANTEYSITGDYAFADNTLINDSTTYALVYNPAGILLAAGDDLDTNDDGTLDVTPWTDVVDTVAVTEAIGSEIFYLGGSIIGPDGSFMPPGVYRCPDGGTFDPGNMLNFNPENGTPDSTNAPLCTIALTSISAVQGGPTTYGANNFNNIEDESPLIGSSVTVQGVVVGDFQEAGEFSGFFIQEETTDEDGNAATSEGVFVFCDTTCADVSIGNVVTVTGAVDEYFNHTQIDNDNSDLAVIIDDAGNNLNLVTAATVSFPLTPPATATDPFPQEAYEGMLVNISSTMRVTEYFEYGRYTQTRVWSDGTTADRPYQFTQTNAPDASGFTAAELAFRANSVFLDDGSADQNTATKPYPENFLNGSTVNSANGFRGGDSVTDIYGVMNYARSSGSGGDADWRIHVYDPSASTPIARADGSAAAVPTFTQDNPRPGTNPPTNVAGTFKVGSTNVLNYFTDIDDGTCGLSSCRGADDLSEFQRQHDKITQMICEMDSDVIGLVEIQNDATDDALNILVNGGTVTDENAASNITVDGLNTICPTASGWDYIPTGAVGTDAIRTAFIYDTTTTMQAAGTTAEVLDDTVANNLGFSSYLPLFNGSSTNRAALAVTFEEIATGAQLTIANNHFKSKGGSGSGGNADAGDGQGNWNERRTQAAEVLRTWLAGNPTGTSDSDVLIIGDLNAYGQEDPIIELTSNGYTDLAISNLGLTAYSYVFDGRWGTLDYALANTALNSQVAGIAEWHINADEPTALSYDETFDPSYWYENNFYRASDHDPVIVGLNLSYTNSDYDFNSDGIITPTDVIYVVNRLGTNDLTADVDSDGDVDSDDVNFMYGLLGS